MIHESLQIVHGVVTEQDRAKASIKYELNYLRHCLRRCFSKTHPLNKSIGEIKRLCVQIAHHYLDYLHLIDGDICLNFNELISVPCHLEHFHQIQSLEQKLEQAETMKERTGLIIDIVILYKMISVTQQVALSTDIDERSNQLRYLFSKSKMNLWLTGLIDFWSRYQPTAIELADFFHYWTITQQQLVLKFFADKQFIDLANAVFFYKLYPENLFPKMPHPEKLVSVRSRLGILHYYLELIQQQFYSASIKNGLTPGVDYLLHGDKIPDGIVLEIDESCREIICAAIKQLKVCSTLQYKDHQVLELLYDLKAAYKFWFNPNRLIDAVMAIHQSHTSNIESQLDMSFLFCELTTTECLDLYGYFSNNDSRYLLYTFFSISQGVCFDWLHELQSAEKKTITKVFHALLSVMNLVRTELKERRVITKPYAYSMIKEQVYIGHRNRDAVFWALTLYGGQEVERNDFIEHLFHFVENI